MLEIINDTYFLGALTKSKLMPRSRKGWLKSTTCSRWKLIVRSAMAKSARCNNTRLRFLFSLSVILT